MRVYGLILNFGLMACVPPVSAAIDFDPATLGHMKGVLESCSGVNRQAASQYLLQMKALIGTASKQEVAKIRKTRAYQAAYQSVRAELSNREPQALASTCASYLAERN